VFEPNEGGWASIPWTLDELVDSFLQAGGFWTQDALIAIKSPKEEGKFTVVEGNRRMAALTLMREALRGKLEPPRWLKDRLTGSKLSPEDELFTQIPYLLADSREGGIQLALTFDGAYQARAQELLGAA
jgi:hypothetical protein